MPYLNRCILFILLNKTKSGDENGFIKNRLDGVEYFSNYIEAVCDFHKIS